MADWVGKNATRCPCKGCTERTPGCHDHCEKYQPWKKAREECKAAERREAEASNCMPENVKRQIWRQQRWRNKGKVPRRYDGIT